jgi:hypothetical protein
VKHTDDSTGDINAIVSPIFFNYLDAGSVSQSNIFAIITKIKTGTTGMASPYVY